MKVAIIGSRSLQNVGIDFAKYLNLYAPDFDTIVSGGAKGIDTLAANFAHSNNIPLIEFLPQYEKYGRRAPLVRNDLIIAAADMVFAFYDGESRGTLYTINKARKAGKEVKVFAPPF